MSCSCCNAQLAATRGVLEPPYAALDKEYITPAHQAAQASMFPGSLSEAFQAIKKPNALVCLEARDNNGRTPLMYAVHAPLSPNGPTTEAPVPSMGFLDVLLGLPDVVSSINHQDRAGNTALHWAAQEAEEGGAKILEALVAAGAALDVKNAAGETPLHLAAINNCLDNVRYLAEAGADIHAAHGALAWQALHNAAYYGHTGVFAYLLSRGADINATTAAKRTALSLAAQAGHIPIVRYVLDKKKDGTIVRFDAKDEGGYTPLNWACLYGHYAVAQALLDAGADLQSRSAPGQSTTYFALRSGSTPLAGLLLAAGAPVDAPDAATGRTPLHWMAHHAGSDLLRLLLIRGADVNARTADEDDRQTPLHVAVRSPHAHHLSVLDVLLSFGADVQAVDRTGRMPLAWALARGNLLFTRKLLDAHAKAGYSCSNVVDEKGRTALHYACRTADAGVVQGVLDLTAEEDWGRADGKGQNALHFAAAGGSPEVAELLLEKQVKSVRDANGWTPARIAEAKGFTTLASRLEEDDIGALSGHSANASSYTGPKSWDVVDGENEYQIMDDGTTLVLPGSIIVPAREWHYNQWSPLGPTRDWIARADHCCPPDVEEYYFEVEIVETGGKPWEVISIGWAMGEDYASRFDNSSGGSGGEGNEYTIVLDSDDGRLHANAFDLPEYGPKYGKGDIIGTGVNFADHSVYFTHNGTYLGTAVTNVRGQLYPLVSTNCPGLRLSTRFNIPPPPRDVEPPSASRAPVPFRTAVETQLDDLLFTLYQAPGLQYTNPRLSAASLQALRGFSVGQILPGSWQVVLIETDWTGWPPDALARFRAELATMVCLADPPADPVFYRTQFLRTIRNNPDPPLDKVEDEDAKVLNQKIDEAWERATAIYRTYMNVRGLSTGEQMREAQKIRAQGGKVRWRDTSKESAQSQAKVVPLEKARYEMPVLEQPSSGDA